MNTRELVIGRYSNNQTYILYKENGEIFKTIHEGQSFSIPGSQVKWHPTKVAKANGHGTMLVCRRLDEEENVVEQFPLRQNQRGLWANTINAEKKGVFHFYCQPQNAVETVLFRYNIGIKKIQRVSVIDVVLEVGGQLCDHVLKKKGYGVVTDCNTFNVTRPEYVPDTHFNKWHRGCIASTYQCRFFGGTYLVYYRISTKPDGKICNRIEAVYLTRSANYDEVAREIRKILK